VTPDEKQYAIRAAAGILNGFYSTKERRFWDVRDTARKAILRSFEKNQPYPDWAIFLLSADKLPRNVGRDLAIVLAVQFICIYCDLPATRNRLAKSGQESGCSIVAAALERLKIARTEAAVNKIYERQNQFPTRFVKSFVHVWFEFVYKPSEIPG
jgi:hypothetical protein